MIYHKVENVEVEVDASLEVEEEVDATIRRRISNITCSIEKSLYNPNDSPNMSYLLFVYSTPRRRD